jgi:hypothetical protein
MSVGIASIYAKLQLKENQFRLLEVEGGTKSDEIRCRLFVTSMGDKSIVSYEALSYVWGEQHQRLTVMVNDHAFPVTTNLEAAMRHLRFPSRNRTIWADAVCINQDDINEVNVQVGQMDKIYYNAQSAAVWLGEASSDSDYALEILQKLSLDLFIPPKILLKKTGERDESHITALKSLFKREYWNRLWVIQEISVAKSATLYCGKASARYHSRAEVQDRVIRALSDPPESIMHISASLEFSQLASIILTGLLGTSEIGEARQSREVSLLDLLDRHRTKACTDPRDKVFSLKGISALHSSRHNGLTIDYNRSVVEVYTGVVVAEVEETGRLDIICASQSASNPGLSSWVPDWRIPFPAQRNFSKPKPFRAAGNSPADVTFSGDGRTLKAKGVCIGRIICVAEPLEASSEPHITEKLHSSCRKTINEWKYLASDFYPNASASEAFWSFLQAYLDEVGVSATAGTQFADIETGGWPALASLQSTAGGRSFFLFTNTIPDLQEPIGDRFSNYMRMGLALDTANIGDLVCILLGCSCPVVLRPKQNSFILVSDAYTQNYMHGKAMDELSDGSAELRWFTLQ